jgi:hypothetical protein
MHLDDLCSRLGLTTQAAAPLAPYWDESEASFPEPYPTWLEDGDILASRCFVGLDERFDVPLAATARAVRGNPALARLAWHAARLAFEYSDYDLGKARLWPDLGPAMGSEASLFYLLVAFRALPPMVAAHARRGIPANVSRATCTHFLESTALYSLTHGGRLGVHPTMLGWLRHHVRGEICCLGRFEYMAKPFEGRLRVFRHRRHGLVVAIAAGGVTVDATGLGTVPSLPERPGDVWTTIAESFEGRVSGHPIAPEGRVLRAQVHLDAEAWAPVLGPGDPILETHIPPGGGMTPERCVASMREALAFFPRHFPESPFVGFACYSWILNPELAEFYSPTSNMVLWQRELYLFPIPSNGRAGLQFIFGREDPNPSTAPRDTSIRRALLDRFATGLPLRAGGMFCLPQELADYGSQPYRRRWPEVRVLLGL